MSSNNNDPPPPPQRRAPLPTFAASSSFQIRAPLSSGYSSGGSSSSSGIEFDTDVGSGSEPEYEPAIEEAATEPVPGAALERSESMPVARLTGNDETEEEEEVFDEVDGDGFVVRVRVVEDDAGSDPNPSSDNGGGDRSPKVRVLAEDSEEEEVFDEVDGDGFSTSASATVSFSQDGSASSNRNSTSVYGADDDVVLGENPSLGEGFEFHLGGGAGYDDVDREKEEILGGEVEDRIQQLEDFKSMDVDSDNDGADVVKESRDVVSQDEKYEIFGNGSDENSTTNEGGMAFEQTEAESSTVETATLDTEEDSRQEELEAKADRNTISIVIAGYDEDNDEDKKLDDEDTSGKSESSTSKLDGRNDNEAEEAVSTVSSSLAGCNIADNSAHSLDVVRETQLSVVNNEKAATKLQLTSGELEARPNESAGDAEFLGDNTGEQERGHISDGQFAMMRDYQEEIDSSDEDGEVMLESDTLLELLRAAASSSADRSNAITASDAARTPAADSPAGLGSLHGPLKPAQSRKLEPAMLSSSHEADVSNSEKEITEKQKKFHEKVELLRIKYLRLVHRLGHSPSDKLAESILYHLARSEGMTYWRSKLQSAQNKALELEREEKDKLDLSCCILVIGKAGVGKSATINSIFEEEKSSTNPFNSETTSVRKIEGFVNGIRIQVLDTPGLKPFIFDQPANMKILSSVRKYIKKCPPDIVLYVDRLDIQTQDSNDIPLLKTITITLGTSIWSSAIIALTHAAAAPPEGPSGFPLSYEACVDQRSRVLRRSIWQATGHMMSVNPVVLVENHPSCRRNREGHKVLPNGSRWRSELLLMCCSSKFLSEFNSLSEVQDSSVQKLVKFRSQSPLLHFFLSSLLEPRAHPKLPSAMGDDNDDSDIDLDDFSDLEDEEEEYDQLPPFRSLTKSQIANLTREHKRAYLEEYDYRVKLLEKKQWKEKIRRLKEIKKRGESGRPEPISADVPEDLDDDAPAHVATPLPDMDLPASFDSDNPAYLYRFLEPDPKFWTGLVVDRQCWDHDYGYDGVSFQKLHAIASWFPAAVSGNFIKDKESFSGHLESSVSAKHRENGSSLASVKFQTIRNQLAYSLRGESKFNKLKKNKITAGVLIAFLGGVIATGLKLEGHIRAGKRINLAVSTGGVRAQGDVACVSSLKATIMKMDYPLGQALATLGLSMVSSNGNLNYSGSLESEVQLGRNSKMEIHVGLNNRMSGEITTKTIISGNTNIPYVGLVSIVLIIFRRIWCS